MLTKPNQKELADLAEMVVETLKGRSMQRRQRCDGSPWEDMFLLDLWPNPYEYFYRLIPSATYYRVLRTKVIGEAPRLRVLLQNEPFVDFVSDTLELIYDFAIGGNSERQDLERAMALCFKRGYVVIDRASFEASDRVTEITPDGE